MKTKQKYVICAVCSAAIAGHAFANTLWVTNNANAGAGTLRDVVQRASNGDRIAFDFGAGATNIQLKSSVLIGASVEIDGGSGVTIRGHHLEIASGCAVTFSDIIFTGSTECGYGGAVYAHGDTTFRNCCFANNRVSSYGAAIYNDNARCKIRNCTFTGNTADGYGGAVYNWKELAVCDIANSTFKNNRSNNAFGGAVYADKGLKIRNCSFVGNWADSYGGAVKCDECVIIGCTFDGNSSGSYGGAVMTDGGCIVNCTFRGNRATTYGGAVLCWDTVIVNCTAVGNSAGSTSGAWGVNQSGCWHINNIAVGNSSKTGKDIFNCLDSHLGYSIFGDLFGSYSAGEAASCLTGKTQADVLLAPQTVDVNGVSQLYYPIKEGGGAENAGVIVWHNDDWSAVAYSLTEDGRKTYMRGSTGADRRLSRDQLGRRFRQPSIGSLSVPMFQVTSCADSGLGSLREALNEAEDGDTILFDLRRGKNVIELKAPLVIGGNRFKDKGITVGGDNGGRCVTIKGNGTFQLLTVKGGNKVNVDGITFKNGKDGFGGAIGNYGSLTVRNCGFAENASSTWGGAICNMRAASCYVQNCDFVGNTCDGWGGAIASHTTPLTTLLHCRFADNTSEAWGGAIAAYSTGDTLVIDCKVNGNAAYGGGGIVAQDGARVTVIGSDVSGNSATAGRGNDIFNLDGTINAVGAYCESNYGTVTGTTDLPAIPKKCSSLASTETKALGSWYSKVVDASGRACMQLNAQACPRFAARTDGKPTFELTDEEYVTMKVENVKPLLYYGLGWADTLGGEFVVEPGMWLQADENGVLPGEVKAPKGTGSSRFFRVKVTDDPSVVK